MIDASASDTSKWKNNKFSWTKDKTSKSAVFAGTRKKSSAPLTSYHKPTHHNMTWKKPTEGHMPESKQVPASKYKFVANPGGSNTQSTSGITLTPCAPQKQVSSNPHYYQNASLSQGVQNERRDSQITSTSPVKKSKSVDRNKIWLPTVQKCKGDATKDLSVHELSTSKISATLKTLPRKPQGSTGETVITSSINREPTTSTVGMTRPKTHASPTGITSQKPQRQISEKRDSHKITLLAKELDKCLKDIADLKKNQNKAQAVKKRSEALDTNTSRKGQMMNLAEGVKFTNVVKQSNNCIQDSSDTSRMKDISRTCDVKQSAQNAQPSKPKKLCCIIKGKLQMGCPQDR